MKNDTLLTSILLTDSITKKKEKSQGQKNPTTLEIHKKSDKPAQWILLT